MVLRWLTCAAIPVLAGSALYGQTQPRVQNFPLRDAAGLIAPAVKAEAASYLGRTSVRMTIDGDDHAGLALLPGTDFQDGVIEADIAVKITTPPGVRYPGFVGIAFRARPDASHYEVFYLRPGNSGATDQAMRNHSVQYASEPGFDWYHLRREWPGVYESQANIAMTAWTHIRVEVAGRAAKLYLNGSVEPTLVVDGLKGEDLRGAVGLWGFTDEETYFSQVRITPAAPQSLKNGADVAGSWQMRYASDAGTMDGSMELRRDGDRVTGTWSGPLGDGRPVAGTWRNGYVELSFTGEWPKGSRRGAPGSVTAYLAGWVDGDSAKGRMRVQERSDGVWTATRTPSVAKE
jgi:hypothetical protein